MIRYASEKGLGMIALIGKAFRGDAMAQHGDFAEGTVQMREGIRELRSMGTLFTLLSPSWRPR